MDPPSVLVIDRSARFCTVVVAVAELLAGLGSVVELVTVAVFVTTVPFGVFAFAFSTIVKTAVSPAATAALEKVMVPVPPTAGVAGVHPLPVVTPADTNVVPAGITSVTCTEAASDGPLFAKLTV